MARQKRPKIVLIDQPDDDPVEEVRPLPEKKKKAEKKVSKSRRKPAKTVEIQEEKPAAEMKPKIKVKKTRKGAAKEEETEVEVSTPKSRKKRKIKAEPEPEPIPVVQPKRSFVRAWMVFAVIAFFVLGAFILIPFDDKLGAAGAAADQPENCLGIFPDTELGLNLHELECTEGYWEDGKELSDWLLDRGVSYRSIITLQEQLQGQRLKSIGPGQVYTVLHAGDIRSPHLFAYQTEASEYVLLQLQDEPQVIRHQLKLWDNDQRRETVTIEESLSDAMFNREFGLRLTQQMQNALKWDVDFFHLEPGDQFILLYDIKEYEGHRRDLGRLSAVRYSMNGQVHHAFYFENDYVSGYYDDDGRAMKANFLKAPLDYVRISSPYNLKRSDPFTGKIKAHLGTDYAAPMGTEIVSVADGIVTHAEFKGNNGNYVKILHSETVQTQYLHMQSFAQGIEPGARVKQGQVIGYVGMTGRATGPHVCFRFWKNGQQVDHRQERGLGSQPPLRGDILEEFMAHRDSLWNLLEPI